MKTNTCLSGKIIIALFTLVSSVATAAVTGTKHDLSATSGNNAFTSDTAAGTTVAQSDQVCVFCHTPHNANSAGQPIPLWNHETTAAAFTLYSDVGTGTLDGETASGGISGVSLACLSCHDGTVAVASVINAPGSGTTATTDWGNGTWSNPNATLSGTTSTATLAGAPLLDNNLSNDHPVAIQYAGGGYVINNVAGGFTASTPADGAFEPAIIAPGSTQAWVDVDGGGLPDSGDIPLFTNVLAATPTVFEPFVECASCHNPHGTSNDMFLRDSVTNSTICISCHTK